MITNCTNCGRSFNSFPSANAQYCSPKCWKEHVATRKPPSKGASRKRAQRKQSLAGERCAHCGSTSYLDRHHTDYNDPLNVVILCRQCHRKQDILEGKQEVKPIQQATCCICGKEFQPSRKRNSKMCGKAACRSELGRMNARKRWTPVAQTD